MLVDCEDQIGACTDGGCAFIVPQSVASIVDSVDRGRASSVASDRRPLQVEDMIDSIADDTRVDTSRCIAMSEIRLFERHFMEVGGKAPGEASGIASINRLQRLASRLKRFVADFQELSLLGIHRHGLDWRDAEQCRIELLEIALEEVTPEDIETAWAIVVGMEM